MHDYQKILTHIANQSVSTLPPVEPDPNYWQTMRDRYHEVIGMIELARYLEMPELFIAALEEHRDRLKPPREAE